MKQSAGILLYRVVEGEMQFFLVHPGGPFWKDRHKGTWSIPKGEFAEEEPLAAAAREFYEETGHEINIDGAIPLNPVKLKSGKVIHAWAVAGDVDPNSVTSNMCMVEWPPHSGKKLAIPEIDQGGWFNTDQTKAKINAKQFTLVVEALSKIKQRFHPGMDFLPHI